MVISHVMFISAVSHTMYLISKSVGTYTSMHVYGELGIGKMIPDTLTIMNKSMIHLY